MSKFSIGGSDLMSKNIPLYRPLPIDSDRILDAPYIVDDFYLNILD